MQRMHVLVKSGAACGGRDALSCTVFGVNDPLCVADCMVLACLPVLGYKASILVIAQHCA